MIKFSGVPVLPSQEEFEMHDSRPKQSSSSAVAAAGATGANETQGLTELPDAETPARPSSSSAAVAAAAAAKETHELSDLPLPVPARADPPKDTRSSLPRARVSITSSRIQPERDRVAQPTSMFSESTVWAGNIPIILRSDQAGVVWLQNKYVFILTLTFVSTN